MHLKIRNATLCELIWKSGIQTNKGKVDVIINDVEFINWFSVEQIQCIRKKLYLSFVPQYNRQWQQCLRIKHKFCQTYEAYLEKHFKSKLNDELEDNLENCVGNCGYTNGTSNLEFRLDNENKEN